jgi:hypothetical protein
MGSKLRMKDLGYNFKLNDGFNHRDGTEYVLDVFDKNGNECAYFKFNHWLNHPVHGEVIHVMEAEVVPAHRRLGIATHAYNMIEEFLNLKIQPEAYQQSSLAKAFWKNRV